MNQAIRGVLFDLDGTLVDSIGCYWRAFNGAMEHFGMGPIDVPVVASLLDRGARIQDILKALLPSLDEPARSLLRSKIVEIYVGLEKEHVRLMPGARELLSDLRFRKMKVGVATSRVTRDDGKWRELERFGLDVFVDAVVTAADIRPKPAPDTIIECVRQLGLVGSQCVYVGDSTCDVIAAREAGLMACSVTTGVGHRSALLAAGSVAVLDNLTELVPWLERIGGGAGRSVSR